MICRGGQHEADVVEYRDAMTILRDRIQDLVKKGPYWLSR